MKEPKGNTETTEYKVARNDKRPLPFIYLSTALRKYSSKWYYLKSDNGAAARRKATAFGPFLGKAIEEYSVLIFDACSLRLLDFLEQNEVTQALLDSGKTGFPIGIGLELGRDYCLDRDKLEQIIRSSRSIQPPQMNKAMSPPEFLCLPEVGIAPPPPSSESDDWGTDAGETEPPTVISLDEQTFKLLEGRLKSPPTPRQMKFNLKYARDEERNKERKTAATKLPARPIFSEEHLYLTGKMNREGRPVLFLGNLDEVRATTFADSDSATLPKQLRFKERNDRWQRKLNEMYRSDPPKSHTQLCKDLAKEIDSSFAEKHVCAATIQKITHDPGHRSPGGRRAAKKAEVVSAH